VAEIPHFGQGSNHSNLVNYSRLLGHTERPMFQGKDQLLEHVVPSKDKRYMLGVA
jgi:hypothetical protein